MSYNFKNKIITCKLIEKESREEFSDVRYKVEC